MMQARRGWIGVDFGARAIKLAQLERDGRGVRLVAASVVQRAAAAGGSRGAELSISGRLAAAPWSPAEIRAALALEPGFRGRASAGALSLGQSGVRTFALPPGSDAERRSMLGHSLLDALGAEAADCEFDYWETGASDASDEQVERETIGVVYAPRQTAVETARNLSRAGLRCEVLDGLPLALARAVELSRPDDDELVAAVDWGYAHALFLVARQGQPLFVRPLRNCGFGNLLASVAEELGLSRHDVQQLLSLYGVPAAAPPGENPASDGNLVSDANLVRDDDSASNGKTIEEADEHASAKRAAFEDDPARAHAAPENNSIANRPGEDMPTDAIELAQLLGRLAARDMQALVQELVRTLNHLRMHRSSLAPARICLCGGGATILHVDAWLGQRLDLPVEIWRLPRMEESPATADAPGAKTRTSAATPGRDVEPMLAAAAGLSVLGWTA